MRAVLQSDVVSVARVLLRHPADEREALAAELIRRADAADRYARRLGKCHPDWGNGTLLAAAHKAPLAPERAWNDPAFLHCLQCALEALRQHRLRADM